MSRVAADLIINMCRHNQSSRFDVYSCLQHPFITRDLEADLPMDPRLLLVRVEKERLLGKGVSLLVFLASVKLQKNRLNENYVPADYLEKVYNAMNSTEEDTPPEILSPLPGSSSDQKQEDCKDNTEETVVFS